jgi:hypothetical protein
MGCITIEDVDLASLTEAIRCSLGEHLEANYLRGKAVLRDAVVARLGCSMYEAEKLVETLESQGYVRFPHYADRTHPAGRWPWEIGRP